MLYSCQDYTGVRLRVPFGTAETLTYIGWLLEVRKVKGVTIEKYLAGLRTFHLKEGFEVPALRPDNVKSIINGAKQMDEIKEKLLNKLKRLAMTLPMMELLKFEVAKSN